MINTEFVVSVWFLLKILLLTYFFKETFQMFHNIIKTISSVQSLSRVQLFATPWTAAHQASLSITNSRSSLKLMSIESVMPSSHLILCRRLLLLPLIPPSIRVFSNESTLGMRWPKCWSFSFSIIKNYISVLLTDWHKLWEKHSKQKRNSFCITLMELISIWIGK